MREEEKDKKEEGKKKKERKRKKIDLFLPPKSGENPLFDLKNFLGFHILPSLRKFCPEISVQPIFEVKQVKVLFHMSTSQVALSFF